MLFRSLQLDDLKKAEYALVKATVMNPKNPEACCFLSAVLSKTGRMELAIIQLENACKNGFRDFAFVEKDPFFSDLRSTAEYKSLRKAYTK